MKTRLAFLAVMVLATTLNYAQEIKIAPVVGIFASTSLKSNYAKDQLNEVEEDFESENQGLSMNSNNSIRPGFKLGALADFTFNETISIQSGVLFLRRGYGRVIKIEGTNYNGDNIDAKANYSYGLSYLEIPVWIRYSLGSTGIKLIGGPSLGFALGGKLKVKGRGANLEDLNESQKLSIGTDMSSLVLPFDFSLNLGVGKEFEVANNLLEITAYVQPSLSKWNTSSRLSSDIWYRHFSAGIRAAYYLPIR